MTSYAFRARATSLAALIGQTKHHQFLVYFLVRGRQSWSGAGNEEVTSEILQRGITVIDCCQLLNLLTRRRCQGSQPQQQRISQEARLQGVVYEYIHAATPSLLTTITTRG